MLALECGVEALKPTSAISPTKAARPRVAISDTLIHRLQIGSLSLSNLGDARAWTCHSEIPKRHCSSLDSRGTWARRSTG